MPFHAERRGPEPCLAAPSASVNARAIRFRNPIMGLALKAPRGGPGAPGVFRLSFAMPLLYKRVMRHLILILLCVGAGLGVLGRYARAGAPDYARMPEVRQAENYLRSLTTARARFVQTAPDGVQTGGTFYLSRPGRLRFQYDAPSRDFVVADGFFIYFYDGQAGEQTNAPIGQTLADFLLRTDLRLSGDLSVYNVRRAGDLLQISISQTSDPAAGTLILGFTENPMSLKKWRVIDGQGLITEVELSGIETGLSLASDLFVYRDAQPKTPRYNP